MTVNLSALGGAGQQFLDGSGNPLTGGKLYSYQAGTTTPQTTYTNATGTTAHANPIILDSAGRVPTGEIWVTAGLNYKFVLNDSADALIATWDNITGINGTGIATSASTVSFTGFKAQSGVVQDIANSDGSNWIGFNQPNVNAIARSAQDKMADIINVKDFGAVGDGVIDDTNAFVNALNYIASKAITVAGYKTCMPALYLPNGNYRVTQKKALSSAFQSGGVYAGICFFGDGRFNTQIFYDSANTDSDNYLASFTNCSRVEFSELTIRFAGSGILRGIEWFGGSGPQGSVISWKNVDIEGNYKVFFDVTGSVLGSETYWENVLAASPTSGNVFFNVASNAQSVNHFFINCTIGCAGGTIFNFNAGGNFKWYGGYTSFLGANPGTFLNIVGSGSFIGSNNRDFLIDGWHPETATSNTTATILNLNASAFVTFSNCNFNQPSYVIGHKPFVIGQVDAQRGGQVNFIRCLGVLRGGMALNGAVIVDVDNCPIGSDWQNNVTLTRGTVFNLTDPIIRFRNTPDTNDGSASPYPTQPKDCVPFVMERITSGSTGSVLQQNGHSPFIWTARAGNSGTSDGLIAGYNSTYASFTCKLPLGTVLKKVYFKYIRNGNAYPAANRTYKVTDNSGATIFIPETTFAGAGPTTIISADLWYVVNDETSRNIVISGYSTTGSAPGATHGDVGYVVLEYV